MSVNPNYDKIAEVIRQVMLQRLTPNDDGQKFAILCFEALVRDNKLSNLLFNPIDIGST